MNKRGGTIVLTDVKAPDNQKWGTAQEAMSAALELEKKVNDVRLLQHISVYMLFKYFIAEFVEFTCYITGTRRSKLFRFLRNALFTRTGRRN